MGDPSEHAKLSPSKGYQWLHCTASIGLIEQLQPKNETSSFAHEGTVCHNIAADILTGKCQQNMTNQTIEGVLITSELWAAIRTYVKRVLEVKESLPGSKMLIETKVSYSEDCWGTADTLIYTPLVLYPIDLKMGKGHEVYSDAEQLKIYGAAARKTLGIDPAVIMCEIVQPRIKRRPCTTTYTAAVLTKWEQEVLDPAIATIRATSVSVSALGGIDIEGPGIFKASEAICLFCLPAPCPAQAGPAVQLTGTTCKQLVEQPKPQMSTPSAMPPEQVIPMFQKRGLLKEFIKALEKHIFARTTANDPAFMKFFKMIEGRTQRQFRDPKAVEMYLAAEFQIPEDQMYNYKLKSPAQMEALLTELGKDPAVLKTFIFKPKGKPTVAPADSRKKEVKADPEALLKANPVGKAADAEVESLLRANPVVHVDMAKGPATSSVVTVEDGAITEIKDTETPTDVEWNKRTRANGIITRERGEVIKHPGAGARADTVRTVIAMTGNTIDVVAAKLGCEPKSIQNHINNINKRYGYATFYDNNTGVYRIDNPEAGAIVEQPAQEQILLTEPEEIPEPPTTTDIPKPPPQSGGFDFLG